MSVCTFDPMRVGEPARAGRALLGAYYPFRSPQAVSALRVTIAFADVALHAASGCAERDLAFRPDRTLSAYADEARRYGTIVV